LDTVELSQLEGRLTGQGESSVTQPDCLVRLSYPRVLRPWIDTNITATAVSQR